MYIAAASTNPKLIELGADEFNGYLVSDGLAHVWLERAREKTLDRPAKERYQKWIKTLVSIGPGPSAVTKPVEWRSASRT